MRDRLFKFVLAALVLACCLMLAFLGFSAGYNYVVLQDERFKTMKSQMEKNNGEALITAETPGALEVYIPRSASVSQIADLLAKKGIISNRPLFKILSKFNGFDGHYQSGTHYLLKEMNYDEIMFVLTRLPKALTISFPEGMTYRQMKAKMIEAGLKIDEKRMDELVQRPNAFLDYGFIRELPLNSHRKWFLQGYLWPDTYRFDPNMDEESILRMFLDNTEKKLKDSDYAARATLQGMTLDDVMKLASIVQEEGSIADMSRIAKVFLNRLKINMPLESEASINYLRSELGEKKEMWMSQAEIDRFKDSPYDSFTHKGLPPGPINNPGTIAIEAVLWPATEKSWEGADSYLYFCATGNGGTVFSKTLEEHEANVAKYSQQKKKAD